MVTVIKSDLRIFKQTLAEEDWLDLANIINTVNEPTFSPLHISIWEVF